MARRAHRQRSQGASRAAAPALAPPSPPGRRRLPPLSLPAVTRATVVSKSVVGQLFEGKPDRRAYPQRRAQTAREEGKRHGIKRNAAGTGGVHELTFNGCAPCSRFMSLMLSLTSSCEMRPYKLDLLEEKSGQARPDEVRGEPWQRLSGQRCERTEHVSHAPAADTHNEEQKQPPKLPAADSRRHQPLQVEVLPCEPYAPGSLAKVRGTELTEHVVMGRCHDRLSLREGSRAWQAQKSLSDLVSSVYRA